MAQRFISTKLRISRHSKVLPKNKRVESKQIPQGGSLSSHHSGSKTKHHVVHFQVDIRTPCLAVFGQYWPSGFGQHTIAFTVRRGFDFDFYAKFYLEKKIASRTTNYMELIISEIQRIGPEYKPKS